MAIETTRAGLIVYHVNNNDEIEILTVVPIKHPVPQLPKGKIKNGERMREAAARETVEETGLFLPNLIEPIWYAGNLLDIRFYCARIKDKTMFGLFNKKEIKQTKWMTFDQFANEGRSLQRPFVQQLEKKITKRLKSKKRKKVA